MSREVDLARGLVARVRAGELSREQAMGSLPASFARPSSFDLDLAALGADTARRVGRARGTPAGPGAASGALSFSPADAVAMAAAGLPVILAVDETFPEDNPAITASRGLIAVRGGLTGHAAIVARALGKPCLCSGIAFSLEGVRSGSPKLEVARSGVVDELAAKTRIADDTLHLGRGQWVSLDGKTGDFVVGTVDLQPIDESILELAAWADRIHGEKLTAIVANARDAKLADRFGAARAEIRALDGVLINSATSIAGELAAIEAAFPGELFLAQGFVLPEHRAASDQHRDTFAGTRAKPLHEPAALAFFADDLLHQRVALAKKKLAPPA